MTLLRIGLLISLMAFGVSGIAKEISTLDFKDYPTKAVFTGKPAKVILDSDDARAYRTRLREAAKYPADFAGENVLALWGCGTSCIAGAAVNLRTGRTVPLPGSVCCNGEEEDRLQYHKDSRLFIAYGRINESELYGRHYYVFTGREFKHIRTVPMEDPYTRERDAPENGAAHGWLGVQIHNLTPEIIMSLGLKTDKGALVTGILKGGPADRAGVETGDVLVSVNGRPAADSSSLLSLVESLKPGETAKLLIARKDQNLELLIYVGRRL